MSCLWRYVTVTVDARLFERFGVCLEVAAKASTATTSAATGVNLAAATADEHHFDLLLEGGHIGDVRRRDAAAAEHADMRELVEVGQSDPAPQTVGEGTSPSTGEGRGGTQ